MSTFPLWALALSMSVVAFATSAKKAETDTELPQPEQEILQDASLKPFGHWLFDGNFADAGFVGFSPDYVMSVGDSVNLKFWGAIDEQMTLTVDPKGNVFIPKVGPVKLSGVTNKSLADVVTKAVSKIYSSNVGVYASLAAAEPVRVFVTGFVARPGLYGGHSADSILRFIDLAGGIEPNSGSYQNVVLKRDDVVIEHFNLYDFLLTGVIPRRQLRDGDIILVEPSGAKVAVTGLVDNSYLYELPNRVATVSELLKMARAAGDATNIRVTNQRDSIQQSHYALISDAGEIQVHGGDEVEVVKDITLESFTVRIEGEHFSHKEFVVENGQTLAQVLTRTIPTHLSDVSSVQLYRQSVKDRQKIMLDSALSALESSLLTARSNTADEAQLRHLEAELVLQWVERARHIEPRGQVILGNPKYFSKIILEPGDRISIPKKSAIVMVHGDVVSPTASIYEEQNTVQDYINLAGGFNQKASNSKVLVMSRSGRFKELSEKELSKTKLEPGDEVMVLPSIATKSLQVSKDLTQVIYQIAVSAGTVLRLVL
ncbi:polysaccharide biosynthesis/export family protein [Vibrio mediterranei]|uniref:polysaccharide biosynthesis/export family protein n=1 Tax=Vibrio mediterranei TaxID=689 RepID=UPI0040683F4A